MSTTTFRTFCPIWIARDEPTIECDFTVYPSERKTRDYPGTSKTIVLDWVSGIDRELTDTEFNILMGDYNEDLVRQAEEEIDRFF